MGSELWRRVSVCGAASYHASSTCVLVKRASAPFALTDHIGRLRGTRRTASAPDLATAFDLCAAASLLRARQASQEPARPRRAAKHATCPCGRAPASSKVGSGRTARRRASCPLNGPPRHRPAFRWRLRRAGPRQPASGEGWGGRAGSSSVHVRREGRPAATPLRGSPAAKRACPPAAQRPRRAGCRLGAASQTAQAPPPRLGRGPGRSGRLIQARTVPLHAGAEWMAPPHGTATLTVKM